MYGLNFLERPRVYFHGWSWVQSDQKEERPEFDWSTGPCYHPWPACCANIMLCAATSTHGVLHHHATLGPYNAQHLLTFLSDLRDVVLGRKQQDHEQVENPVYVILWDNISFHHAVHIRKWFTSTENSSQFAVHHMPHTWTQWIFKSVEGLWPPTLHQGESPAGRETGLWWHRCGGMPSLDPAHQGAFPLLPGQGESGLWCGWSPVASPSMHRHDAEAEW